MGKGNSNAEFCSQMESSGYEDLHGMRRESRESLTGHQDILFLYAYSFNEHVNLNLCNRLLNITADVTNVIFHRLTNCFSFLCACFNLELGNTR